MSKNHVEENKPLYKYCLEVQVMYFDVFFSIVIASKIVYFDIKISTIRGTTIKYNVRLLKKSSSFIPYFLLMIDFIDIRCKAISAYCSTDQHKKRQCYHSSG